MTPSEALMASSSLLVNISVYATHGDHLIRKVGVFQYRPDVGQVLMQFEGKEPDWYTDSDWTVVLGRQA